MEITTPTVGPGIQSGRQHPVRDKFRATAPPRQPKPTLHHGYAVSSRLALTLTCKSILALIYFHSNLIAVRNFQSDAVKARARGSVCQ